MTIQRLPLPGCGDVEAFCVGKRLDGSDFDASTQGHLEALSTRLGISVKIRQARQVHADAIDLDGSLSACDAFLVRPGEAAMVRHADCFPVVVASDDPPLAIVAHCGWKGVEMKLAAKAVGQLLSMGCDAARLSAAIGPGIRAASFEVGPEVLARFPTEFHARTSWSTPSIDLPAVLLRQLTESGISPARITTSDTDTFSDPQFHSFRRERELSGRNATLCIVRTAPNPHQETQP